MDELERCIVFVILYASAIDRDSLWSRELEREYLERWPIAGVRVTPRTRQPASVPGSTANTRSPSISDLPDTHPLKRGVYV